AAACLMDCTTWEAVRAGILEFGGVHEEEEEECVASAITCQKDLEVWQKLWPEICYPVRQGSTARRRVFLCVNLWAALLPDAQELRSGSDRAVEFVDEVAETSRQQALAELNLEEIDQDELPEPEPHEYCPPLNSVHLAMSLSHALAAKVGAGNFEDGEDFVGTLSSLRKLEHGSEMSGAGIPFASASCHEVTLRREGAHEREVRSIRCLPKYEYLRSEALRRFREALMTRGVDETTVVLRWRDQDGLQFTIHGQEELRQAMKDAVDDCGMVHLDFLLQVQPASREQRTCRVCAALFTSRNQLFQHLKDSGHDDASDQEPEANVPPLHETLEPGQNTPGFPTEFGNQTLHSYYACQHIASQQVWEQAYEALKKPLPLVVRISSSESGMAVESRLLEMTEAQALPLLSHCWMLPSRLGSEASAFLAAAQEIGALHRQEWASTLPVLALDVRKGDGEGLFVANDYSRPRAVVVAQRCRRRGKQGLMVTNCDGRKFPSLRRRNGYKIKFQKVLVDAPCSGDGTLRKNPGNWRTWCVGEALTLHTLQVGLLRRGFECLEAGGRLVYSTCSLNPLEDEAVVAALLKEFPSAAVESWEDAREGREFQEGLTTWKVPDMHFERTGGMYSSFAELAASSEPQKWALESMFPPSDSVAEQLRKCRRVLPTSPQAHHGGFFVAVLSKQSGTATAAAATVPPAENEEMQPVRPRRAAPQPPLGLFLGLPDEVRRDIEDYWGLYSSDMAAEVGVKRFPSEQLRLNALGQVVLTTRMLSQCSIGRKVELPIVEAACTMFPSALSRLPFDEAVPLLAECATKHVRQLTTTQFRQLLEEPYDREEADEEEARADPFLATCHSSGALFAVVATKRRVCTSRRYVDKLLVVLESLECQKDTLGIRNPNQGALVQRKQINTALPKYVLNETRLKEIATAEFAERQKAAAAARFAKSQSQEAMDAESDDESMESEKDPIVLLQEEQQQSSVYISVHLDADAAYDAEGDVYSFAEGTKMDQGQLIDYYATLCEGEPLLKCLIAPFSSRDPKLSTGLQALRSKLPEQVAIVDEAFAADALPIPAQEEEEEEEDSTPQEASERDGVGRLRDSRLSVLGLATQRIRLLKAQNGHHGLCTKELGRDTVLDFGASEEMLSSVGPLMDYLLVTPDRSRRLLLPTREEQELQTALAPLGDRIRAICLTAYRAKKSTDKRKTSKDLKKAQFCEGLRRLGYKYVDEYAAQIFDFVDQSSNDSISPTELRLLELVDGAGSLEDLDRLRIWLCEWKARRARHAKEKMEALRLEREERGEEGETEEHAAQVAEAEAEARESPLAELWQYMDRDGSGEASFAEFRRALRKAKHPAGLNPNKGPALELFMCRAPGRGLGSYKGLCFRISCFFRV
ncbi:Nsun2, partial [Symbiodinium sp. KB8]